MGRAQRGAAARGPGLTAGTRRRAGAARERRRPATGAPAGGGPAGAGRPGAALEAGGDMGTVETIWATVVMLLAAVACVGALLVAIAWEVAAFRRIRDRNRKPTPEESFWRTHQAVTVPERRR